MDNVPTQTAGTSELLASDWNTYVRDNFDSIKFGHVVVADATARTNLGNVAEGVMVYQSDNNKVYVNSNGTTANWVEVADLDNTGAVSDDAADYLDQYAVSFRNVIINGSMSVAQRGTSVASITTSGYRTADRFKGAVGSLGTWTQSIENDAPTGSGFRKSLKMLCTTADAAPSAGDFLIINQIIEGQNLQHFCKGTSNAKKFAMSFWVKSNKTGNYVVELFDGDNTRHVCALYNVSASGTWEKKTVVFPADTTGAFDNDTAGSLEVNFWLDSGSNYDSGTLPTSAWASVTDANRAAGGNSLAAATNNYWQVTGVQLEAGDVATPFEFEPFETTLRKCMRYYEKTYSISTVPGTSNTYSGFVHAGVNADGDGYAITPIRLCVPKRSTNYTVTAYLASTGASGSWYYARSGSTGTNTVTFDNLSETQFRGYFITGGTWVSVNIEGHYTADAEL